MKTQVAAAILTIFAYAGSAIGESDWPGWRGADRTGRSDEAGLLKEWPEGGPKQLWVNRDAGVGYSSFSVVGGKLFTMGAREGVEQLLCLDAETGEELWATDVAGLLRNGWGDGPRSCPTVDGDFVYAIGGKGDLVCAQAGDGKIVWSKSLTGDFGGSVPSWGYTESPLVDGNVVVCTPGGKKGAVVALDKGDGKTVWQSGDFTDAAQYSSVIAADHNGARQYIQLTMQSVVGLDSVDGKVLWKTEWPGRTAVIPTPIFRDGNVYVASGYGVGCKLVKIGEGNAVEEVYKNDVMVNHHGGVILVGEHLYGYSDKGGWVCQDFKTGEEVWSEKGALKKGAVAYADGHLYCLGEGDGAVVLVEATAEGWNEKGRFVLEPQTEQRAEKGKIWTHPIISNGKLYLRDQELIHCYDISAK